MRDITDQMIAYREQLSHDRIVQGIEPSVVYREPAKPTSAQTKESEVVIPTLQAAIPCIARGVLISLAAWVVFGVVAWALARSGAVNSPAASVAIVTVSGVVSGIVYALWNFQYKADDLMAERRELLWRVEEALHRDLDGDGQTGPPHAKVNYTKKGGLPTVSEEQRLLDVTGEDGTARFVDAPDGTPVYVAHLLEAAQFGMSPDLAKPGGVKGFTVTAVEGLLRGKPRPATGYTLRQYANAVLDTLTDMEIISQRGGGTTSTALVALPEARRKIGNK